ncbi:MAG: phosphodiester glycosidase family protein [Candidatus Sumerlaeota bacterium]
MRLPGKILFAFIAIAMARVASAAPPDFPEAYGFVDGADFHIERTIAPGITQRFDSWSTGPLTINTVFIATNRKDLAIEVEKANDDLFGAETLPAMAKRLADPAARPLVQINADFWGPGHIPIGPVVDEGMIWKAPWFSGKSEGRRRSVFGFDDQGNLFIGLPDWKLELRSENPGEALEIPCVNIDRDVDVVTTLFTYPGRAALNKAPAGFKQIILRSNTAEWLPNAPIKVVVRSIDGSMSTVPNASTFLLHLKTVPPWLKEGMELTLDASLKNLPGKVTGLVGGQPRIVEHGKVVTDEALVYEATGKQFLTDLHPRSAVGLLKDGKTLVLCVVDGRQPRKSIGIDLYDLGEYMKNIGCEVAMNFDGGGSSSIAVGGEITNFPSDAGGPRPVSDAVVVRRIAPLGSPSSVEIVPSQMTIPTGSRVELQHIVADESGEAIPDGGGYSLKNAKPTGRALKAKGDVITAMHPGEAKVKQKFSAPGAKSITGVSTVTVVDPTAVSFSPPVLLIDSGDVVKVSLNATAPKGTSYFQDFEADTVEVPQFLQYDQKARTIKALSNGKGLVRAKLGGQVAVLPVAVGEYDEHPLYAFDTLPSEKMNDWVQLTNATGSGTNVTLESGNKKSGDAAWRLAYAMARGGTSKIALPIDVQLPVGAPELGLWVYGDGNEHWLRGELEDSRGETYLVDFTDTKGGIDWKDTWKFCTVSLNNPSVRGKTKSSAVPPFKLQTLYIVQPQEAAKKDGAILLDGLSVLDLPADLKAQLIKTSGGHPTRPQHPGRPEHPAHPTK